jgi:hypothetical protein
MKYQVDIEFRYTTKNDDDETDYHFKTCVIGIYNTLDDAVQAGNIMLESQLETRFKLNEHWNVKERFSKNNVLISELAYLRTPFQFFARIKPLHFTDVGEAVENILGLK